MNDLTRQRIRQTAYFIGAETRRRQQFGIPVPSALRDCHAALNRELSAAGNQPDPDSPRWKTTKELAAEWGCTTRTVRNIAASAGGQLVGGRWIFPEGT